MEKHCVYQNCGRPVHARGLCGSCYKTLRTLVNEGKTDWASLEKAGHCGPPKPRAEVLKQCLIEGCEMAGPKTRGLCVKCYEAARRRVKDQTASWEAIFETRQIPDWTPRVKRESCLIKGCESTKHHAKGYCKKCYHAASHRIRRGETTWKQIKSSQMIPGWVPAQRQEQEQDGECRPLFINNQVNSDEFARWIFRDWDEFLRSKPGTASVPKSKFYG